MVIENGDRLVTGNVAMPIVIRKNDKTIKRSDIEDYLGAVAHIILIGEAEKDFIHIHPESTNVYPVYAHAEIPKPGRYRMWIQFQTGGIVHTADFTLDVKASTSNSGHGHSPHKH